MGKFDEAVAAAKQRAAAKAAELTATAKEAAATAVESAKTAAKEAVTGTVKSSIPDLSAKGVMDKLAAANPEASEIGARHGEAVRTKWGDYGSFVKAYVRGDADAKAEFDTLKRGMASLSYKVPSLASGALKSVVDLPLDGSTLAAFPPYANVEEGIEHLKVVAELVEAEPIKAADLDAQLVSMLANSPLDVALHVVSSSTDAIDRIIAANPDLPAAKQLSATKAAFANYSATSALGTGSLGAGLSSLAVAQAYVDRVLAGIRAGSLNAAEEAKNLLEILKRTDLATVKQLLASRGDTVREIAANLTPEQKRKLALGGGALAAGAVMLLLLPYLPKVSSGSSDSARKREVERIDATVEATITSVRSTFHDYLSTDGLNIINNKSTK